MALDELSFLEPIDSYILGNAPLDDVVHRLTHWVTELNPPEPLDESEFPALWVLWSAFNKVAQRVLEKQERLVELLLAIKNLPPVLKPDGERLTCWGGRFWEDLPIFGPNMRESWNCKCYQVLFLYISTLTLCSLRSRRHTTRSRPDSKELDSFERVRRANYRCSGL